MYAHPEDYPDVQAGPHPVKPIHRHKIYSEDIPVAAIPCSTLRQARLLVGFANLGEERRVEEVAEALQESNTLPYEWGTAHEDKVAQYQAHARAILSLTGLLSGQTAREGGTK